MTGTDPDYISAMEHFEAMRHEDIYRATQQIDAGEILRISGTWMHAATTLQTSLPLTRAGADRVMNAMEWDGAAADAAFASTRSFADSVEELAGVLGQVGLRLGAVAAAAEAVKIAVVPPGDSGPVGALARLLEAAKVIDAQMVQEVLHQEAILTMNMVYKPAYLAAGTAVPALPEPPAAPGALPPLGPPAPPRAQVDTAVGAGSAPAPAGSAPTVSGSGGDSTDSGGSTDSPAPQHGSTPPAPATPSPPAPSAPESSPAPSPEPSEETPRPPTPEEPAPTDGSAPAAPPAPTEPAPAPPAQPPAAAQPPAPPSEPAPVEPPAPPTQNPTAIPLSDPGGQPGITGPVPGQRAPDQPGVIPPQQP
ncbi:hypothetical protein [Nocardia jinanensis]|uniref:Uncharacterized protein n=1 Tax=Nocardia jinanensis TaxID=382504 RepID=A0A917RUJ2_9NOCA|nr:hypothetical protein [Nocardia jinanensis]GGL34813.1 hypothetical protein GCM10011588_56900 [Nocardia jinanensis]